MKKFFLVALVFLAFSFSLLAQPPGDPGDGDDPDVPITGIEWLVGLGGALGVRYFYKKKNKSN